MQEVIGRHGHGSAGGSMLAQLPALEAVEHPTELAPGDPPIVHDEDRPVVIVLVGLGHGVEVGPTGGGRARPSS
jgi:hypothetical protein